MHQFIRKAFTLIELLVVIAIIGILSGLIVVAMGGMTTKANIAKAQVFSNSLRNSLIIDIVGEWKFDGSGVLDGGNATTAYTQDTWAQNNAALSATPPTVYSGNNCVYGSCLFFNGSSNYLAFNNPILGAKAMTVCVWASKVSYVQYAGIITDYKNVNGQRNLILGYENPAGTLSFYVCDGTSTNSITFNGFSGGVWHYVCGSFVGSGGEIAGYIDGIKMNKATTTISAVGTTLSPYPLIGRYDAGYYFNGYIDDIRIYDAAIPISQIKENYFIGLNNLLANGNITSEDYISRINSVGEK